MIVIVHQTIGMTEPAIPVDDMGKPGEELHSITVVHHDILPGIPPTGDMIDGPREFNAEWTSHEAGVYFFECAIARPDPYLRLESPNGQADGTLFFSLFPS